MRESALITPKTKPAAALKAVAFNDLQNQGALILPLGREEGKEGDAKVTFVGSINSIPLCQLN